MRTSSRATPAWLSVVLCLGLVAPAIPALAQDDQGAQAKVTVLLYSGRPNPSFTLDDAAVRRLAELLAAATPVQDYERDSVMPSILGYNGLVVETRGERAGLPRRLVVYHNDLEAGDGEKRFLRDEQGAIEE